MSRLVDRRAWALFLLHRLAWERAPVGGLVEPGTSNCSSDYVKTRNYSQRNHDLAQPIAAADGITGISGDPKHRRGRRGVALSDGPDPR
jgi:hypothetical protein